ncbi:MAG: T9SS C-terminal target domain-containing protein [Bacteroidetes bacterium]|nr:MAG: T9SS C-terminal target domain-containing protein [Bacteroidota bacterium]
MNKNLLLYCTIIFLAFFIQTPISGQVVINEINYHSSDDFDTKDWLEFHNAGDNLVNIGFWYFKDDNEENIFTFPEGTTIDANGYLVVCRNIENFTTFWPDVDNFIGEFDFGLNNGGELIRLFNASGTVVDTVFYDDEGDWPTDPDGLGPTLQLSDPSLDNAAAENWFAATGTPGAPNMPNSTDNPALNTSIKISPNPVSNVATISIESQELADSGTMLIFNNLGQRIQQIALNGRATFPLDASNLSPGFYTIRLLNTKGHFSKGAKFVVTR